jgi:hypothetical protein
MTATPKREIATPGMEAVLRLMRDMGKSERATQQPLLDLPGLHWRTREALVARDFIVVSTGLIERDGRERYQITSRGLKALADMERRSRPRTQDDLCYKCRQSPRYVSPSGLRCAYCLPCHRAYERSRMAKTGTQYHADKPCGHCKTAPRHVTRGGVVEEYCLTCKRAVGVEKHRAYIHRLRERALAGEFVPCRKCKTAPIHITATRVYIYCLACARERQSNGRRQRKIRMMARRSAPLQSKS